MRKGYPAFAEAALAEREEAAYPPFSHQALLRAEANRVEYPSEFLQAVADWVRRLPGTEVELWGPVPAPMARRVGRYRAHLLIQADERAKLQRFLSGWIPGLYPLKESRQVRWSLDVDPQEML